MRMIRFFQLPSQINTPHTLLRTILLVGGGWIPAGYCFCPSWVVNRLCKCKSANLSTVCIYLFQTLSRNADFRKRSSIYFSTLKQSVSQSVSQIIQILQQGGWTWEFWTSFLRCGVFESFVPSCIFKAFKAPSFIVRQSMRSCANNSARRSRKISGPLYYSLDSTCYLLVTSKYSVLLQLAAVGNLVSTN